MSYDLLPDWYDDWRLDNGEDIPTVCEECGDIVDDIDDDGRCEKCALQYLED